jgi:tungstate transport system substrate-binding protein
MLATTTSTADTGLLDVLSPLFQKETGIELKWTAVGTGRALELGRSCNVDALLVHDPEAEAAFIAAGSGIERTQIMYNDFVLIGPVGDPARVGGKNAADALKGIAGAHAPFISRGDKSGTHALELRLWKDVGIEPGRAARWYHEAGQGMMRTLVIAAEKDAYTLADRGTWIRYESGLAGPAPLKIVVEGDFSLFNQYSSIAVNPDACPNVNIVNARALTAWLAQPSTQDFINNFKLLDRQLFIANAGQ